MGLHWRRRVPIQFAIRTRKRTLFLRVRSVPTKGAVGTEKGEEEEENLSLYFSLILSLSPLFLSLSVAKGERGGRREWRFRTLKILFWGSFFTSTLK